MRRLRIRRWIHALVIIFALIFLAGVALAHEPGRLIVDSPINITPAFDIEIPIPPTIVTTPSALTVPWEHVVSAN